jgi:hypothetical protein
MFHFANHEQSILMFFMTGGNITLIKSGLFMSKRDGFSKKVGYAIARKLATQVGSWSFSCKIILKIAG